MRNFYFWPYYVGSISFFFPVVRKAPRNPKPNKAYITLIILSDDQGTLDI